MVISKTTKHGDKVTLCMDVGSPYNGRLLLNDKIVGSFDGCNWTLRAALDKLQGWFKEPTNNKLYYYQNGGAKGKQRIVKSNSEYSLIYVAEHSDFTPGYSLSFNGLTDTLAGINPDAFIRVIEALKDGLKVTKLNPKLVTVRPI